MRLDRNPLGKSALRAEPRVKRMERGRKGSKFEAEAFGVIEAAAALAPEFSEIAERLAHARRWTGQRGKPMELRRT